MMVMVERASLASRRRNRRRRRRRRRALLLPPASPESEASHDRGDERGRGADYLPGGREWVRRRGGKEEREKERETERKEEI